MTMVTFLPARLGPWAAAGVSARTLDARTSDHTIAIGLIFLLDIFYLRAESGPIRFLLHTIITSYRNQGGAALRHVAQIWASQLLFFFFTLSRWRTSLCSICTAFWAPKSFLSTLFVCCFLATPRAISYRLAQVACKSPESW